MEAGAAGEPIDFARGAPISGNLEVNWIHGSPSRKGPRDPAIQVHPFDEHTVILRESKDVSFEAPFLYLFLGNRRALLLDTGATADAARFPIREQVDRILSDWLRRHPRTPYDLVVAHTHSHGDHVAGDAQFQDRPGTQVVGREPGAVRDFFGIPDWPEGQGRFDLGGRCLEVFGIPGHHPASVAVYDPWTGFLVTGDTVYPGRLYVPDMPAFRASLERLVQFAASRPVTRVMGCHIEMTRTPGRDYPVGARYQPEEPPLPMTVDQLRQVRDAAAATASQPGVHRYREFILYNGPCTGAVLRGLIRGWGQNLLHTLRSG